MASIDLELISLRQAERIYGVPRAKLKTLPSVPGKQRSKLVRVADVEELIARSSRCLGCGQALEPGREWHPACRTKSREEEIRSSPERALARSRRVRERMSEYWSDEANRTAAGARRRTSAKRHAEALARFKSELDLLNEEEVVEAIGPVRWREKISAKYVRELARKHSLGQPIPGPAGKAGSRRLYREDDVPRIRALLKQETLEGTCPDCDRPTYNSIRCKKCEAAARSQRASAWWTAERAARLQYQNNYGLITLDEAADCLDRAKSKTAHWAKKLALGVRVGNGRARTLMFTEAEIAQLRTALASAKSPCSKMKSDPVVELEWHKARYPDAPEHGSTRRSLYGKMGGRPLGQKLSEAEESQIGTLVAAGRSQRQIAAEVGVSRDVVRYYLKVHS